MVSLLSLSLWASSFPSSPLNLSQTPVREGSITKTAPVPPQARGCPSTPTTPGRFERQLQSENDFSMS